MELGLEGQSIIITGASGGIGRSCAKILAMEGANLVLHYNSNELAAKKLKEELEQYKIDILMVKADLRKETDVQILFAETIKKFGRIHGLVNNAGIWPPIDTPIDQMTLDQWNNTIQSNLNSIFLCSKEFMRQLKRYPGNTASIVNIGSTAGVFGEAGHIDYSSSKAALHGLSLTLKNEIVKYAKYGRVNTVSPGWTLTPMAEEGLAEKSSVTRVLQTTAMRKIATSDDIAKSVVFFLSDKMSFHASGQHIVLAGGMEGRLLYHPDEVDPNNVIIDI